MPRNRTIPDSQIFAAIQDLLDTGGDKAVSFGTVAVRTGLAAPTLVQRYGNREGMIRAAHGLALNEAQRLGAAVLVAGGLFLAVEFKAVHLCIDLDSLAFF